jgi:hypothetical protein
MSTVYIGDLKIGPGFSLSQDGTLQVTALAGTSVSPNATIYTDQIDYSVSTISTSIVLTNTYPTILALDADALTLTLPATPNTSLSFQILLRGHSVTLDPNGHTAYLPNGTTTTSATAISSGYSEVAVTFDGTYWSFEYAVSASSSVSSIAGTYPVVASASTGAVSLSLTTAPTSTFYVDAAYVGGSSDGSILKPFKTISAAYSAAPSTGGAVYVALGTYSETALLTIAKPITLYGNGATLNLALGANITANYTAYDLNVVVSAGYALTYAGAVGTERFILRQGTRKGAMVLSSGTLDTQACTQTWSTTSDVMTISGTGVLTEIGCINTLPLVQSGANSSVQVENCVWNTSRDNTYLIESSAGQLVLANTTIVNSSATAGGGYYIHNTQTGSASSPPNIISGVFVVAVNAETVTTGATIRSKVVSSGAISLSAYVLPVTDITAYPIAAKTANYTMTGADQVITISGTTPITITLPTATVAGRPYTIKRTDANTTAHVISGTIDGASSYVFSWAYESIELVATSTNTFAIIGGR